MSWSAVGGDDDDAVDKFHSEFNEMSVRRQIPSEMAGRKVGISYHEEKYLSRDELLYSRQTVDIDDGKWI